MALLLTAALSFVAGVWPMYVEPRRLLSGILLLGGESGFRWRSTRAGGPVPILSVRCTPQSPASEESIEPN